MAAPQNQTAHSTQANATAYSSSAYPKYARNVTIRTMAIDEFMKKFAMSRAEATAAVDEEMRKHYPLRPWEIPRGAEWQGGRA